MTSLLSGQQMTLQVWVGAYSCSSFGHSAWLTPSVVAAENAPRCARWTKNQIWRWAFSAVPSVHRVIDPYCRRDSHRRLSRPNKKSYTDNGDFDEMLTFPELIGSVVVAVPADYTRSI
jgi:hypothetical protein